MINSQKEILIFSQFYHPALKAGGPTKSLKFLEKILVKNFNIKIFTSKFDIDKSLIKRKKFKNLFTYENFLSFFLLILKFIKMKNKNNVFYFNSFFNFKYTIFPLMVLKFFFKGKFLIAPRGELFETELGKKFFKKKIYLKFFKIFLKNEIFFHATSFQEKKSINKLFPKNQIKMYPNVSDSINQKPKLKSIKPPYKFVFFSRISKKKNLPQTIDLLSELNLPVILDIYGNIEDIDHWNYVKKKIKKLKNKNKSINIFFKGFVKKNKYTVLKKYPFFILLSDSENFGHSIFEAMMCGCIPIVTKNSPWHQIHHRQAGLLIDLNQENALKELKFFLLNMTNKRYKEIFNSLKKITKIFLMKQKKIKFETLFNLS